VTFAKLAQKGQSPPGRIDGCGVVDPLGRRFFVFGGSDVDGSIQDAYVLDLDHDQAKWRPLTSSSSFAGIPARARCSAVYDAARARILVGFGSDGESESNAIIAVDL
ncbi:MAG TPA: kelch repeat-containing protein, partial [Myxococcota bacterium]|jgi:hypothetical protein